MIFRKSTKILSKYDKTVLINQDSGQWIRVSNEVFCIIKLIVLKKYDLYKLENWFDKKEDYIYIKSVFKSMLLAGILVNISDEMPTINNKIAMIEITSRCNLNCIHCGWNSKEKFDDLNTKDMINVIDKVIDWNPVEIVLSGGEPLLRQDIEVLFDRIRQRYSGCLTLSTNGTLINNSNVVSLSKFVDKFEISMDGYDEETTSLVRGNGVFDVVVKNINLLKSYKNKNIYLSMVIGEEDNSEKIQKFNELCNLLNVKPVIREYMKTGSEKADNFFSKKHDYQNKKNDLVVNKVEITACSCTAGKRDILVRSNGKVFPCQRFISDNYCMGDLIKSSSVDDIIKYHKNNIKELFKNSLKEIACDKCSVVDFCWTCPAEVINYDKEIDSEDICNGMKAFLDEKIWGKH